MNSRSRSQSDPLGQSAGPTESNRVTNAYYKIACRDAITSDIKDIIRLEEEISILRAQLALI